AQSDLKRMIAYSSVSHMGFVLLGIASLTAEGLSGALFQMVSHGFLSAALFFLVGVQYDRVHARYIYNFRWLANLMPQYTAYIAIAFLLAFVLNCYLTFQGEAFIINLEFNSETLLTFIYR